LVATHIEAYAGTAGHSAWFSDDLGNTWVHPNSQSGMYLEARVWAFSTHSQRPDRLYAGTDMGLFGWDENIARWKHMPSPMSDVWALAHHPDDADMLVAGTRPAGFFLSPDAGKTWQQITAPGVQVFSDVNMGPTRVTQLLFDPVDRGTLWATVEIGGVYRSHDLGQTWTATTRGLVSADVHGIAVIRGADGAKVVFATTNRGLHKSTDNGDTWIFQLLNSDWQYTRAIAPQPGSEAVLFLTNGNGPPGNAGKLLRSQDHGETWHPLALPGTLNSTPWCVATHAHDPMLVFMATNLGQLYRSTDGGDSWERLPHEFGEVRALHWRPVEYSPARPQHSITVRPPVAAHPAPAATGLQPA
jgi:photosystem II stability/assembly factor-like uncharacterized protein